MGAKNIKKEFSKNLNRLLKEQDKQQADLAKYINVSNQSITNYIKGYNMPRMDKIDKMAEFFNVRRSALIQDSAEYVGKVDIIIDYPYIDSTVAAGTPFCIDAQNYSTVSIPNNFLGKYANNKKIFFMRINGNSMDRVIPDKSLIGILPYDTIYDLKNNDIVVFNHDGDYSVKRFLKNDTKIIFRPDSFSEIYTDIVYNLDESNVEIIGKVIMYNVIL